MRALSHALGAYDYDDGGDGEGAAPFVSGSRAVRQPPGGTSALNAAREPGRAACAFGVTGPGAPASVMRCFFALGKNGAWVVWVGGWVIRPGCIMTRFQRGILSAHGRRGLYRCLST